MATTPVSDHDWTVHSINIHGVFFERWCQKVVSETPGWSLDSTNYPVEFPSPNGPLASLSSGLGHETEAPPDSGRDEGGRVVRANYSPDRLSAARRCHPAQG